MLVGTSGVKGILIYNTTLDKENNAVYGYLENEKMKFLNGNNEKLRQLQKEHDKPYEKQNKLVYKMIVIGFIISCLCIVLSIIYLPLVYIISTIFFCVSAFFPILIIIYACTPMYKNKKDRLQFKRFHGAEHSIIFLLNHEKELTLENIKKEKYLDGECGTAYAQSAIVLILVICFCIINIINLGIIKSLFIIFITIVVLLLNVFNRYNPFFLIQRCVVNKPTDLEYTLALEIAEELMKIKNEV